MSLLLASLLDRRKHGELKDAFPEKAAVSLIALLAIRCFCNAWLVNLANYNATPELPQARLNVRH